MAKKGRGKTSIEVYGIGDLLKKIEKADGNLEDAITKSVMKSIELPKADMLTYIKQHHRSGKTEDSFTVYPMEWKDGVGTVRLGFSIKKDGLPAIFLNVGTPKIKPSFFIDNAVDNNIDEIHRIHRDTLEEILKELI